MGAEASKPQPGAKLQVIGAGLPRTGTASFSAALSTLLNGPVYHGGTQTLVSGSPFHIKTWIDILQHTPYKHPSDRAYVLSKLPLVTGGYVGVTDTHHALFVEELLELYPDARVICTVRDPAAWARSMDATATSSLTPLLQVILFWLPGGIRLFPKYISTIQSGRWGELYATPGEKWSYGRDVWERHMRYLERVVPREKLEFFDVREGWGRLCEALGVEEPHGVGFPRVNDGRALEEFAERQVRRGLVRWAMVFAGVVVVGGVGWRVWG